MNVEFTDTEAVELEAGQKLTAMVADARSKGNDWELTTVLDLWDTMQKARPDATETTRFDEMDKLAQAKRVERRTMTEAVTKLIEGHLERIDALAEARRELPDAITLRLAEKKVAKDLVIGLSAGEELSLTLLESVGLQRAETALTDLTPAEVVKEYRERATRMDLRKGDPFFVRAVEAKATRGFRGLREVDAREQVQATRELRQAVTEVREARVPQELRDLRAAAMKQLTTMTMWRDTLRRLPAWSWTDTQRSLEERHQAQVTERMAITKQVAMGVR